jgi:hypothetical protein
MKKLTLILVVVSQYGRILRTAPSSSQGTTGKAEMMHLIID